MFELFIGFVLGAVVGALFYRKHRERIEAEAKKLKESVNK